MKQLNNDNAANRNSYVGYVYNIGEKNRKQNILNELPVEWKRLHVDGYIHIHDLDAYGLTYNCLTFDIINNFPYSKFDNLSDSKKILRVFNYLIEILNNIGNEQSGGMALANFDNEIAEILEKLNVEDNNSNRNIISTCISELILWCNNNHTRMGQTSYYVTLNIGLAKNEFARFIAYSVIDEFEKLGDLVFKPNIVFKINKSINRFKGEPNYYLLEKSLQCTAKKMIPTYLLCDSSPNKNVDPNVLSIMGCRTRVVDNLFGEKGAIGRGNIDNISINLVRLALEVNKDNHYLTIDEKINIFKQKWNNVANTVKEILLDRFEKVCMLNKDDFPTNLEQQLWCESFKTSKTLKDIFKNGTLSIGFIGLSEAIEIITGNKYYKNVDNYVITLGFVKHMRDYCDFLKNTYNLNFSLLATSGELISGRFIDIDKKIFTSNIDIFEKGFYTNSFHIDVDSNLPAYKKIELEGIFHELCNGGCITYVELGEAPLSNSEGLNEYIEIAVKSGIHYLGFNFPKDICKDCNSSGVFDFCPVCNSKNITRLRRVSGYIEILDGFTNGKKNEEKRRTKN